MKNHTCLVLLLLLFFPAVVVMGQPTSRSDEQWENLRELKPGTKISVFVPPMGEHIHGTFLRIDNQDLYMTHRNEKIRLKRENIRSVAAKKMRLRSRTIGALIGFAAGAVFVNYMFFAYGEGYATAADHINATAVVGLSCAGAGLLIGNQFPDRSDKTILYES